jgi:hypothetical protein
LIQELSQAVDRLKSQPLPQNLSTIPERTKGNVSEYVPTSTPPIALYTDSQYSVDAEPDLEPSLGLLAKTIDSLEAEIEDKLFVIWQGISIRQVGGEFWGHPVPLDLIHQLGFSLMPMAEFLDFLGSLNDSTLEFVPSNKHANYVIGGLSAWYITFRS